MAYDQPLYPGIETKNLQKSIRTSSSLSAENLFNRVISSLREPVLNAPNGEKLREEKNLLIGIICQLYSLTNPAKEDLLNLAESMFCLQEVELGVFVAQKFSQLFPESCNTYLRMMELPSGKFIFFQLNEIFEICNSTKN